MKIYHITHIDNLSSILEAGGLLANSRLRADDYTNIAHDRIQDRRARIRVPYARGGTLHDYVPFYFAPRSPMLYTIHKGNVESYQGGQKSIIYLVAEIEAIAESGIPFTFTDGHAIMAYATFYEDLDLLGDVIDWDLMDSRYWFDTEDDPNRKCRRQAEFLVYRSCPWTLVREIGTLDEDMKRRVNEVLQQYEDFTPVTIYRHWYY